MSKVRPFLAGDGDAVRRIAGEANLDLDVDTALEPAWAELWVSERTDQDVVAYALCWRVADELELLQLATRADTRRQGAARQLLETVVTEAKARGLRALFLEVRAGNGAARGLYASLGFEETRVRRRYYSDGEDAVEMRHSLG